MPTVTIAKSVTIHDTAEALQQTLAIATRSPPTDRGLKKP